MSSEVPDGWDYVALSDCLSEFRNGYTYDARATNGTLPITRIETISNGEIDYERVGYVLPDERLDAFRIQKNDILFSHINSVEHIAKVAIKSDDSPLHHGMNLMKLRPNERVEPGFLFARLQSDATRNHFRATCKRAVNQASLNKPEIGGYRFPLPPLDEQRRIAKVLRSVDEAIAAADDARKQADATLVTISDEVFTSALSEGASAWQKAHLEEMLDKIIDYRGVPPPKADGGVPLLTAKNVRFGYLDFEPREFIAECDYDRWMRRGLPKPGDIMFTTEAPLGNVAEFPSIKAALGQRTLTLVPDAKRLDAKFLKWLLLSKPAQDLIWSHATGSTAKGIKQRTFRKLIFGFPALDEQRRISSLLEEVATARDHAKGCIDDYEVMKVALMSDLLSGRVRVPA
ncbi:restriction endonuclease subunit S [Mesorhizobium sp.]|uniref:restriction endonuclease subunit S n=1 Tax=Mesorhizobium sp. TaxID=1871066 RepID=UPI0012109FA8|nr:restriction endonuclease subunit S [Mesorhizobium sp.]TIM38301.1 MAG: hypothetical protein E5Y56_30210 [Mesorhizobium sp.]